MGVLTKLPERFTETAIDDEIVVMKLENGDFFSLSGTAAAAWRLIDGNRDRPAIVAALAAEFDADDGRIAADVDAFLLELCDAGLVACD